MGQGGLSKKAKKKYKKIADAREYREAHPKKKLNAYAGTLGV